MKYIITGSLGHISLPVVKNLVAAGHQVTVISSNADKTKAIEALGAKAAIGSVSDAAFVNKAFQEADAVYLMIPPNFTTTNWLQYQKEVADAYVKAIELNKVKNVVQLSSIGAHMRNGAGPIDGLAYLEERLNGLTDTNVKMLRPSYFFYNLFAMIPLIKNANIMGSNFGNTDEKLVLVHTSDIADAVSNNLLNLSFTGTNNIQYVSSDECSVTDIATALSNAANKPGTPWITFSDDDALNGMLQGGLPETIANGYVQMGKSIREGLIQADYWKNKPQPGKVKLADFVKEFTVAYNS